MVMKLARDILFILAGLVLLVACCAAIIFMPQPTGRTVNCSIAEISPDITPQEREECRRLRASKL
jgi:hypothetical protein